MQIHNIILASIFIIIVGGCEQKQAAQTEAPAAAGQKVQTPSTQAKEVKVSAKATPAKVESSEKKSPPAVKQTTEQSLADISRHGREVTKTQESKSRTRAQIAEDEMLKDLENFK
jgi:hypothetical protein